MQVDEMTKFYQVKYEENTTLTYEGNPDYCLILKAMLKQLSYSKNTVSQLKTEINFYSIIFYIIFLNLR